jgi:hypothetical protein
MDSSLMDAFTLTKPQGWGNAFMQQRRAAQQAHGQQQQQHAQWRASRPGVQDEDIMLAEQ